jgi:flagellar hook-basal body complex protein FliE
MTMAIDAVSLRGSSIPDLGPSPRAGGAGAGMDPAPASPGFVDSLGRLVVSTERAGSAANSAVAGMIDGTADVHDAMIALQQADIALQFTVQVRNKLVQAYQEIMRMPI